MAGSKKKSGLLLDLEATNGTPVTPTAAATRSPSERRA